MLDDFGPCARVDKAHATLLVPLVQTASTLPAVLFSLVSGVLADIFNRQRLLLAVLAGMTVTGAALTALTIAGRMPPALLLTFTFVLGTGTIVATPAYQALVPELVPRQQIPAAAALNSISVNTARAIGPAIAGLLVARVGVSAVFAVNAASFAVYAAVVAVHPRLGHEPELPERFLPALRSGGRYVRHAPVVRRILLRAVLFLVPASALWALLPLIATRRLGLGSGGYGLLLASLGIGSILGALVLSWVREKLSPNALVVVATLVYAGALVGAVFSRTLGLTIVLLLPMGMAWVAFLSNANAAIQLTLPGWVRARGLSAYQMVLFGGQAAGAVLWGIVAGAAGLERGLLIAAGVMAAGALTVRRWPLHDIAGLDRSVVRWPEPQLTLDIDPGAGPILVRVSYTVPADKEQEFLEAMGDLRLSRERTGATHWDLYRGADSPHAFMELFTVPSWEEHLRQHRERVTGADDQFRDAAARLSDPLPLVEHYVAAAVPETP